LNIIFLVDSEESGKAKIMKKFLSMLLCGAMLLSATAIGVSAAETDVTVPTGKVLKFTDVTSSSVGCLGYSGFVFDELKGSEELDEGERWTENGVTVTYSVMFTEIKVPRDGHFCQVAMMCNGDQPFAYGSVNLTQEYVRKNGSVAHEARNSFDAYTGAWPTYDQLIEREVGGKGADFQRTDFDWEFGVWYRIGYQINQNNLKMYCNGEKVIDVDFDRMDHNYILFYPGYMTAYFDNFVFADGSYDVATETGNVYRVCDFDNNTQATSDGINVSYPGEAQPYVSFGSAGYSLVDVDKIVIPESTVAGGMKGDANGDGSFNAKDVSAMLKYFAGTTTELSESLADANGDGNVNAKDAAAMLKVLAGGENKNNLGVAEETKVLGKIYS